MTILDLIFTVTLLAAPPQPTTPHVAAKPATVVPPIPSAIDTRHPWKIIYINKNTGEVTTERSDTMPAASRFVHGVPVVLVEYVSSERQFCITVSGPGGKFLQISTGFKGGPSAQGGGPGDPAAVPF